MLKKNQKKTIITGKSGYACITELSVISYSQAHKKRLYKVRVKKT